MIHINAKDFAQQRRKVLPVAFRIALRASIAHTHVKISIRAKFQIAGMVAVRDPVHLQDFLEQCDARKDTQDLTGADHELREVVATWSSMTVAMQAADLRWCELLVAFKPILAPGDLIDCDEIPIRGSVPQLASTVGLGSSLVRSATFPPF